MAYVCFNCHKGVMVGKSHKHHPGVAGQRWKRRAPKVQKIFKPNLQWARIPMNGTMKRVRLCIKCKRLYRELMSDSSKVGTKPQAPSVAAA